MTKNSIHGWLALDKPLEMTSAHAVAKVKRLMRPEKIGHAGTLDPLASGILPLALGEATKTVPFLMDARKTYRFTVIFGEERNTDDMEGIVTAESAARPSLQAVEDALRAFTGAIWQAPPAFSAVKIDGKRAYAEARRGVEVDLPPRQVMVHALKLLAMPDADRAEFEMECGKGTYVRAIARDLGRKLGCFGYVSALRRSAVGIFSEKTAISLEKLEELCQKNDPRASVLPPESVLDDILAVEVAPAFAAWIRQGRAVDILPLNQNAEMARAMHGGKLLAIGPVESGRFSPLRVFNH